LQKCKKGYPICIFLVCEGGLNVLAALPLLSAAFAAGIVLAARVAPPLVLLVLLGMAAAVTSLICVLQKKPAAAVLLFLFFIVGMFSHQLAVRTVRSPWVSLVGRTVTMEGYVQEVVQQDEGYTAFLFRVERAMTPAGEWQSVNGTARVAVYMAHDDFRPYYGQRLRLEGNPAAPAGQRNPGGFNYAAYLETNGVGAVITARGWEVEELPGRGGNLLLYGAHQVRERAAQVLHTHLPDREAGLVTGLLLGDRRAVSEETVDAYRRLGLAHLLAVSGLHVGFVAAFALFLARRMVRGRSPSFPAIVAILVVLGYVLLTGGRPPVWRAALTMTLALFAAEAGRERDGLQALATAMLLMLFFRPLWLFGLSFQFSFLATAGILLLSPRIEPYLTRLPRQVSGMMAVTLSAQLAVLPLQAAHFGLVSVLAVPLNLICVPLVGVAMALGLAALLIGSFSIPLAAPFLWSALPLLAFLERIPQIPSTWPFAAFYVPAIHPVMWLAYLGIFLLLAGGVKLWPLSGRKVIALLAVFNILLFVGLSGAGKRSLEVTFLDVGQGLAVHIRTPSGGHLLIDAGGRGGFDTGESIVLPYLRANGARQLDGLILTHPHYDHYGGMGTVAERMPVRTFISNGDKEESENFAALLATFQAAGTTFIEVEEGYSFTFDEVSFYVLSPPAQRFAFIGDDVNNNSLVVRIVYKDFSLLITGDAETEALTRLVRERADTKAVVLQVPHHGSRGAMSPAFLDNCSAQVAVIPVGKNMFGHPHPDTLALLDEWGIAVYRNDLHGAVTVISCGERWEVVTGIRP
jgi:competence protein ComEC